MRAEQIHEVIPILRHAVTSWVSPAVTIVSQRDGDPFKVLISCILSLRTKDQVTGPASRRLFAEADTPAKLAHLPLERIEAAIYPVGFYRNKAQQVRDISARLVRDYGGVVPDSLEELLTFKGVGRKTANLVVTLGFGRPGICVDTHVHRICNRWGYVTTKTPEETEFALRDTLPPPYWIEINDLLVTFGQNCCLPVSPRCTGCPLDHLCGKVGVGRHR